MLQSYVPPAPVTVPLTDVEVARLVVDHNFAQPEIAIAIILAESGGNPGATNTEGNKPPSIDRGLWQFNSKWHPEVTDSCAFDPVCSTKAAFALSKGGTDYSQWTAFKNGTFKQFLARAQAALSGIEVPPPQSGELYVDPRLTWISIKQGKDYQVTEVWFYDSRPPNDPESEGGTNIYSLVRDQAGRSLNHESVILRRPDGASTHYTRNGIASHQMRGDSNFDPGKGQTGPYSIQVGDASVSGLGLPLQQHVEYMIVVLRLTSTVAPGPSTKRG
jgi:hypothetical protein